MLFSNSGHGFRSKNFSRASRATLLICPSFSKFLPTPLECMSSLPIVLYSVKTIATMNSQEGVLKMLSPFKPRGPQLSIIPYEVSKSSDFGIDSKISRRFRRESKISQRFPAGFQPTMIQHALHLYRYRRLQLLYALIAQLGVEHAQGIVGVVVVDVVT